MSSSPIQNRPQAQELWTYCAAPIAAGIAIIPVFYGFIAKSALQIGEPTSKITAKQAIHKGFKAAPTIGIIVGTQMLVQSIAENTLTKKVNTHNKQAGHLHILTSSILTGILSAPAYAVFNGQTLGISIAQSLKTLSLKQTVAIVTRESSFLFSLRISDHVSTYLKDKEDNKITANCAVFITGAVGGIIGHPADTALTLWQIGLKVERLSLLSRGILTRALAVGGFSVLYKTTKDKLLFE